MAGCLRYTVDDWWGVAVSTIDDYIKGVNPWIDIVTDVAMVIMCDVCAIRSSRASPGIIKSEECGPFGFDVWRSGFVLLLWNYQLQGGERDAAGTPNFRWHGEIVGTDHGLGAESEEGAMLFRRSESNL